MLRVFRPKTIVCEEDGHEEDERESEGEDEYEENDEGEDICVSVVRWLSERVVLVKVPCREDVHWVLKFSHKRDPGDITPWDESAVQRFLHRKEPDFIVPLALDSDYVIALIGRNRVWRAVKASLYIPEYVPRKRRKISAGNEKREPKRFVKAVTRIERLLRQSPYTKDAANKDWACNKKNVIRPTADTFLFHDFDRNV